MNGDSKSTWCDDMEILVEMERYSHAHGTGSSWWLKAYILPLVKGIDLRKSLNSFRVDKFERKEHRPF